MSRRIRTAALAAALAASRSALAACPAEMAPYMDEASPFGWPVSPSEWQFTHPECWAEKYPLCAGERQAPMDIDLTLTPADCVVQEKGAGGMLADKASYKILAGHPEVSVSKYMRSAVLKGDLGTITLMDANGQNVEYEATSAHLTAGSLHSINGSFADAELLIVHKPKGASTALSNAVIVSVLFREGAGSSALFHQMGFSNDASVLETGAAWKAAESVDLHAAVHGALTGSSFSYSGSVPVPPCSESVHYIVLSSEQPVGAAQVAKLKNVLSKHTGGTQKRPPAPRAPHVVCREILKNSLVVTQPQTGCAEASDRSSSCWATTCSKSPVNINPAEISASGMAVSASDLLMYKPTSHVTIKPSMYTLDAHGMFGQIMLNGRVFVARKLSVKAISQHTFNGTHYAGELVVEHVLFGDAIGHGGVLSGDFHGGDDGADHSGSHSGGHSDGDGSNHDSSHGSDHSADQGGGHAADHGESHDDSQGASHGNDHSSGDHGSGEHAADSHSESHDDSQGASHGDGHSSGEHGSGEHAADSHSDGHDSGAADGHVADGHGDATSHADGQHRRMEAEEHSAGHSDGDHGEQGMHRVMLSIPLKIGRESALLRELGLGVGAHQEAIRHGNSYDVDSTIDLATALEPSTSKPWYWYSGGPTTPGTCPDWGVKWLVMETPLEVSLEQLNTLNLQVSGVDSTVMPQPISAQSIVRSLVPEDGVELGSCAHDNDLHNGPVCWGAANPICLSGTAQSPVNIDTNLVSKIGSETFLAKASWKPIAGLRLSNNGNSLGFETNQMGYATLIGPNGFPKFYQVTSVALRMPSEHLINGKQYPAELQITHKNQKTVLELEDDDALVTSVMFDFGEESKLLKQMLPEEIPAPGSYVTVDKPVDLQWALGPAIDGSFFKYEGSYTTPGCAEAVNWAVFENPMTLSMEQWEAFKAAFPNPGNNRPVQPLNGRAIAKNTMEEAEAVDYKFFLNREMGRDKRETNPAMIAFPIIGTLLLCSTIMTAVFQREDPRRKAESAGGLDHQKPTTYGRGYNQF